MLQFFRRIRRQLVSTDKISRYLIYAIGEIVLVVIGILLALHINAWNTKRINSNQANEYRSDLIDELREDLSSLDKLDAITEDYKKGIAKYVALLDQKPIKMDSIKAGLWNLSPIVSWFNSRAYTIEELITTGHISYLNKEEKKSLLKLKQNILINTEYERVSSSLWTHLLNKEREMTDHLYLSKFTEFEHPSMRGWVDDFNSPQYLVIHNRLAETLRMYEFQFGMRDRIRKAINETKGVLERHLSN